MADIREWDRNSPAGSDQLAQGDDEIRSLKGDLEDSLNEEHFFANNSASSVSGGVHRPGSARPSFGAGTPSNANDEGRLHYRTDNNTLHVRGESDTTRVTQAYGALAVAGEDQGGTGGVGNDFPVEFDTEVYDNSGYFSPTTTRMNAADVDDGGIALLIGQAHIEDDSDTTFSGSIAVRKNGSIDVAERQFLMFPPFSNLIVHVSGVDSPSEDDYYEMTVGIPSTGTIRSSGSETRFSYTRL